VKIGIGYTTRNRIDVLSLCLEEFSRHKPSCEYKFVVIDDNSDLVSVRDVEQNYLKMLEKYPFAEYYKNSERLGIAKSKNKCLSYLKDCDYIYLFDDDCFPISDDWYKFFISQSERTGIQHFL
jgi:GT2 family glycosyltransferase